MVVPTVCFSGANSICSMACRLGDREEPETTRSQGSQAPGPPAGCVWGFWEGNDLSKIPVSEVKLTLDPRHLLLLSEAIPVFLPTASGFSL